MHRSRSKDNQGNYSLIQKSYINISYFLKHNETNQTENVIFYFTEYLN